MGWPKWPVLGVLLVAACGGKSASSPAAARAVDDQPCPLGDPPENVAAQCEARCAAAIPANVGLCTTSSTVPECVEACEAAVLDTDSACAACVIANLSWPKPSGFCNDFECGCDIALSSPRFPGVDSGSCLAACSASHAHQICLRESAPVPPSLGTEPGSHVEISGVQLMRFEVEPSGTFQAIGRTDMGDPIVGSWALDGSVARTDAVPAEALSIGGLHAKALVRVQDRVVAALSNRQPTGVWLFSPDSAPRVLDLEDAGQLGSRPRGGFLVSQVLAPEPSIQTFASTGEADGPSWPLTVPYPGRFMESRSGDLLAIKRNVSYTAPKDGLMRLAPGASEPTFNVEQEAEAWLTLIEAADGRIIVGGFGAPRASRATTSVEPVVRAYSAAGEPLWQFRPEDQDIDGMVVELASDPDGNVYVASTEDPVSVRRSADKESLCTVYGCRSIVVRALAPDGKLLFEHNHREAASEALDIAWNGDGITVLGSELHEKPATVLLGFGPAR